MTETVSLGRYAVIEDYGPGETPLAVAHYHHLEQAQRVAAQAQLGSRPVEPGDEWGPDYYVIDCERNGAEL